MKKNREIVVRVKLVEHYEKMPSHELEEAVEDAIEQEIGGMMERLEVKEKDINS